MDLPASALQRAANATNLVVESTSSTCNASSLLFGASSGADNSAAQCLIALMASSSTTQLHAPAKKASIPGLRVRSCGRRHCPSRVVPRERSRECTGEHRIEQ